MTTAPAYESLSDAEYNDRTHAVFAVVEQAIDDFLAGDVIDIDSSRTGGLLEMSFPDGSKIVLNTQPPLHEIWLAARSGGFHFKPLGGRWVDTRDGREFYAALSACASDQGGLELIFSD